MTAEDRADLAGVFRRGALVVRYEPAVWPSIEKLIDTTPGSASTASAAAAGASLTRVHASRGATVFRSAPDAEVAFYWKEFRSRGAWDPIKSWFRASRAERAHAGAGRLRAIGLEAPRTLALGVERRLGRGVRSFLVTEPVTGLVSLEDWARAGSLGWRERRTMVAAVASALARLHGAGLVHGDLRPSNVLCARDAARIVLLDNERTRRSRSRRERLRNLVQLAVDQLGPPHRTDRVRFARAYARALGLDAARARALVREIDAAVRARRRRRASRGLDPLTGEAKARG